METKKEKIVSAVATIGIILMLFGATYAYFASRTDAGKITDVEVTANTVDVFSFETGGSITLSLDQESFAEGTGDKLSSTFAKATLTPNNKTNTATDNYYVYLNITGNTFSYSLGSNKPEILLQVTDADGATVTNLDGLTYSNVTNGTGESISGFDITTKTGLITLVDNKVITANDDMQEETWNVNVVFVNYNENQADNGGNSFSAKLMIQEELIPRYVSDVCENGNNLAECVKTLYNASFSGATNIYYHDSTLENGAGDNSYRYAGANNIVSNYVCFASEEENCPDDNLYRIIGVFDNQVKLIKAHGATSELLGTDGDSNPTNNGIFYWNNVNHELAKTETGSYNNWNYSELNKTNLNKNFLENIGKNWADKISMTTWKVGGNESTLIKEVIAKESYYNEILQPSENVESTCDAKVGLMYVNDYLFSTLPANWKTIASSYSSCVSNNWLKETGSWEWTITRVSNIITLGFNIYANGSVGFNHVNFSARVRPVFYLNSDVSYKSGTGTKTNPITINLD